MNKTAQSSQNEVPRFLQIIDYIRNQIHSGELVEHAAVPSERIVAEHFNVSRMTARRALVAIETEGLAYSSGRKGRFVSPKRLTYDISNIISFTATAKREDLDLTIKLISSEVVEADRSLADKLAVKEGDELYRYSRLIMIKGHPTFIEVEYAVARMFPNLLDHDLCQSTTLLLEKQYNTFASTGNIMIRMRTLSSDEAKLLGLATYQAGIELEQITCDKNGTPYFFDRQIWRGELAEFSVLSVVRDSR